MRTAAETLRDRVLGNVPSLFREEDRQIEIRVRNVESYRQSFDDVRNLVIDGPGGQPLRLLTVAEVREDRGPAEIHRIQQQRAGAVRSQIVLQPAPRGPPWAPPATPKDAEDDRQEDPHRGQGRSNHRAAEWSHRHPHPQRGEDRPKPPSRQKISDRLSWSYGTVAFQPYSRRQSHPSGTSESEPLPARPGQTSRDCAVDDRGL